MTHDREKALAEFKRMVLWILLAGVLLTIGALWYISRDRPLELHVAIATIAGVFFSVLLGCGLFAAAFFSDKSGHDQNITDATRKKDPD